MSQLSEIGRWQHGFKAMWVCHDGEFMWIWTIIFLGCKMAVRWFRCFHQNIFLLSGGLAIRANLVTHSSGSSGSGHVSRNTLLFIAWAHLFWKGTVPDVVTVPVDEVVQPLLCNDFNVNGRLYNMLYNIFFYELTYGPRKAVAEVSNHNEPIGKGCAALMRKSIDVRLKRVAVQAAWLSTDFDCHLIWDSLVRLSIASSDSSELVVKCCEIEANRCHLVLNLVVNWRVTQVILAVNGLRFKWLGSQLI